METNQSGIKPISASCLRQVAGEQGEGDFTVSISLQYFTTSLPFMIRIKMYIRFYKIYAMIIHSHHSYILPTPSGRSLGWIPLSSASCHAIHETLCILLFTPVTYSSPYDLINPLFCTSSSPVLPKSTNEPSNDEPKETHRELPNNIHLVDLLQYRCKRIFHLELSMIAN